MFFFVVFVVFVVLLFCCCLRLTGGCTDEDMDKIVAEEEKIRGDFPGPMPVIVRYAVFVQMNPEFIPTFPPNRAGISPVNVVGFGPEYWQSFFRLLTNIFRGSHPFGPLFIYIL